MQSDNDIELKPVAGRIYIYITKMWIKHLDRLHWVVDRFQKPISLLE